MDFMVRTGKCKTDSKYVWHFNLQENIQRNVLNAFEI